MKTPILFLMVLMSFTAISQEAQQDTLLLARSEHSATTATIRSALLPGWGQAYNKKYWKIPIVYAGIGTCVYFIDRNTKEYKLYRNALIAVYDEDPATENSTPYNATQLTQLTDDYRRLLDISYISLAAVYALNILDANVDGHLFHYDVSEDLSLNVRPSFISTDRITTGIGVTLNF